MPYVMLVSVIIGVTNIIPFFGPFIGAIPTSLFILMESPIQCIYFIIFIILLQQFDGNILGPKILGDSTGISSFWVLFSILLFGGLFGFVGMIIGVPTFAVFYDLVSRLVNYGLRKKKMSTKTEDYKRQSRAATLLSARKPPCSDSDSDIDLSGTAEEKFFPSSVHFFLECFQKILISLLEQVFESALWS